MLNVGPGIFEAGCGARVEIKATGDFHLFLLNSKRERIALAGPWSSGTRVAIVDLPEVCDMVEVCVEEGETWQGNWRARPPEKEQNSGIPKAIPIEQEQTREEVLQEMVQRAVAAALQRETPQGISEEQDENDFDVPDEEGEPLPLTGYEFTVMQEEVLEAHRREGPESEAQEPTGQVDDGRQSQAPVLGSGTEETMESQEQNAD